MGGHSAKVAARLFAEETWSRMNADTEDPHGEQSSVRDGVMIPVFEEQLEVSKRVVTTGTLSLQKLVEQHVESVSVPLTKTRWHVERIAIDQVVQSAPEIRHEGETTIYPVLEERVVVTRELVLTEEVRVTRVLEARIDTSTHTVTRERVREERTSAGSAAIKF